MSPPRSPGYVDRANERIAAERRVLTEAREIAARIDEKIVWGYCPWCGVLGDTHPDGCEFGALLALLAGDRPPRDEATR